MFDIAITLYRFVYMFKSEIYFAAREHKIFHSQLRLNGELLNNPKHQTRVMVHRRCATFFIYRDCIIRFLCLITWRETNREKSLTKIMQQERANKEICLFSCLEHKHGKNMNLWRLNYELFLMGNNKALMKSITFSQFAVVIVCLQRSFMCIYLKF